MTIQNAVFPVAFGAKHSDQNVAAIAKIPAARFGGGSCKELIIYIAANAWPSANYQCSRYLQTIADALGRSVRTIQRAQAKLTKLGFLKIENVKDPSKPKWNKANIYRPGRALFSLFWQLVTTPRQKDQGKDPLASDQRKKEGSKGSKKRKSKRTKSNDPKTSFNPAIMDSSRRTHVENLAAMDGNNQKYQNTAARFFADFRQKIKPKAKK